MASCGSSWLALLARTSLCPPGSRNPHFNRYTPQHLGTGKAPIAKVGYSLSRSTMVLGTFGIAHPQIPKVRYRALPHTQGTWYNGILHTQVTSTPEVRRVRKIVMHMGSLGRGWGWLIERKESVSEGRGCERVVRQASGGGATHTRPRQQCWSLPKLTRPPRAGARAGARARARLQPQARPRRHRQVRLRSAPSPNATSRCSA